MEVRIKNDKYDVIFHDVGTSELTLNGDPLMTRGGLMKIVEDVVNSFRSKYIKSGGKRVAFVESLLCDVVNDIGTEQGFNYGFAPKYLKR